METLNTHRDFLMYVTHSYVDMKQFAVYVRLLGGDWHIHALVGVWYMKVRLLYL